MEYSELLTVAREVRKTVIAMANRSRSPHVGSALSCVDILVLLYWRVLRLPRPPSEERDYLLLSKAHAAMALYATLFHRNFIEQEIVDGYFQDDGTLPAHTDRQSCPYIEISAGSLGHGLPMGVGMAHALRLQQKRQQVYVVMGDGETQEGSVWEAAMLAPRLGLTNLCVIIDHNNLQGYGRPTELVAFEPMAEKWRSFGWHTETVDGHAFDQLAAAIGRRAEQPRMILCRTVKGKGVSFMENELIWHYYVVTDQHRDAALRELG